MSDSIERMDIKEFRDFGYLQEVNRRFFHPLGLALEVRVNDETKQETLGGIWDYRDDPEGIIFMGKELDGAKAVAVKSEELKREEARMTLMGSSIQPLDWVDDSGDTDDIMV